jgi:hypothetical protein
MTLIGSIALANALSLPATAATQPTQPDMSTPVACNAPAGAACPTGVQPGGLDHFLCYQATGTFALPPAVKLTDQFGVHNNVTLSSTPQMLCNPVTKTLVTTGLGGVAGTVYPVSNPDAHLYCFSDHGAFAPTLAAGGYDVKNQFGTFHVGPETIGSSTQLCLPSWKYDPNATSAFPGSVPTASWTDPSNLELNHFQCYSVSLTTTTTFPTIKLQDEFNTYTTVAIGNIAELCAPVIKQVYSAAGGTPGPGSAINSDGVNGAHLLCFDLRAAPEIPSSPQVSIGNQFTTTPLGSVGVPAGVPVTVSQSPIELCLPSFKTLSVTTGTPEVPTVILLPILGVAVGGGSLWIVSRRRRRMSGGW